jgi:sRNA-binding protein
MERHPSPALVRETAEKRSLRLMADEAEKLAPRFERLSGAVYQALTNNRVQTADRDKLFGQIMRELRKREAIRRRSEEKRAAEEKPKPLRDQRRAYRDAYANQMRQPRDTWNPDD